VRNVEAANTTNMTIMGMATSPK